MPDTYTDYTPNNTGVTAGSTIDPNNEIANRAAIQTSVTAVNTSSRDTSTFKESIERVTYIRFFDDNKVLTGANSISITADAVKLYDASGDSEQTAWGSSGSINVTAFTSGVIWAIYPGKTYTATDSNPASKPANAYRVFRFTNTAGTVTVQTKDYQNAIDADKHIFEAPIIFNSSLSAPGNTNTVYALPTNYHDVRINYTDANTITVLAGSRVRSSDDTTDIIFSANLTCALNVSGVNGLDTGSEASNTWYYLYAIYNPTTLTSARLFSTVNEAVSGSITLPSGFTKKRQLKFAVRNNASGDILPFSYRSLDAFIRFQNFETGVSPYRVYSGAATSWTGVSLATLAPPISTTVQLQSLYASDSAGTLGRSAFLRKTGTSLTTGIQIGSTALSFESSLFVWDADTNSSQSVDIRCTNINGTLFLDVLGFYVTEVK